MKGFFLRDRCVHLFGNNFPLITEGPLNGALVGAIVYRLLDFSLRRSIGESASFINGAVYVAFVLLIPYGIVGTWRLKPLQIRQGWEWLLQFLARQRR